jgi:hypothetical protein
MSTSWSRVSGCWILVTGNSSLDTLDTGYSILDKMGSGRKAQGIKLDKSPYIYPKSEIPNPKSGQSQITSTKLQRVRQAVRQAHGPEQSRRTHHPEPGRRVNLKFQYPILAFKNEDGYHNPNDYNKRD